MIEAVNSVVSGASSARNIAVEANVSNAANSGFELGDQVARAPVAPFVSPYYAQDVNFDTTVVQIRDSETGDVLKQFPSEKVLEQRQALAERQQAVQETVNPEQASNAVSSSPSSPALQASESTAFRATAIAQQGGQSGVVNSAGAAEAQIAIAAFSAGAQSGQGGTTVVNTTA